MRKINKAKRTNVLLQALCDYGFTFDGIKKFQLPSGQALEIDYPDNQNVLEVLSAVAQKVKNYYSRLWKCFAIATPGAKTVRTAPVNPV